MRTAELKDSLAYWRREYSKARGLLAKARADARAGGDGRTPGVITRDESAHIKKRQKRVDECLWYIARRKKQLAASERGPTVSRAHGFKRTSGYGALGPIRHVTVHHSAGPRPASMRQAVALIRSYDDQHTRLYGGGIGYHEIIDTQGRVYPVRSAQAKGAHTRLHNTQNYGISLLDNFDERRPTRAQLDTLAHRLTQPPPAGSGLPDLRRENIRGHYEWPDNSTACPGRFLKPHVAKY